MKCHICDAELVTIKDDPKQPGKILPCDKCQEEIMQAIAYWGPEDEDDLEDDVLDEEVFNDDTFYSEEGMNDIDDWLKDNE